MFTADVLSFRPWSSFLVSKHLSTHQESQDRNKEFEISGRRGGLVEIDLGPFGKRLGQIHRLDFVQFLICENVPFLK